MASMGKWKSALAIFFIICGPVSAASFEVEKRVRDAFAACLETSSQNLQANTQLCLQRYQVGSDDMRSCAQGGSERYLAAVRSCQHFFDLDKQKYGID